MAEADALLAAHQRLCFQRAFPASAAARRRAERALARFEQRLGGARDDLGNSGIAGTRYSYAFNERMSRWLAATYGSAVTIDWDTYKKHTWDEVAALFSLIVAWAETDGLDDDQTGSWDWVRAARRGDRGGRSDLQWLFDRLDGTGLDAELKRHLYETLQLPVAWDLRGAGDSITHLVLPARRLFTGAPRRERPADFIAAVRAGTGPLEPVAPARADRYIRAARAALSLREREFHVIVHAHRDETYRTDAGRGLEIVTFGLVPGLRLALEADYGCLLLRNGVPIGYAYAAILFERCDIGINIFPEYRDGESAYAFTALSALFHQHFGSRDFVMRRYQLGDGNPEGIGAGVFWFYWKLGYRPVNPRIRALAEGEAARLARRRGARSDDAMLRRLARSDLVLRTGANASHGAAEPFRDYDIAALGHAVTRVVERRHGGVRASAVAAAAASVRRWLGVRVPDRLAPIAALIPRPASWPAAERAALARALRAKTARGERGYVLALLRAKRFRRFVASF